MRKRLFYIIHLDKERILFLSIIGMSITLFSFLFGYKLGKEDNNETNNSIKVETAVNSDKVIKSENFIPNQSSQMDTKINIKNNKDDKKTLNQKTKVREESKISIDELQEAEAIKLNKAQTNEINLQNEKQSDLSINVESENNQIEWKDYKEPFREKENLRSTEKTEKDIDFYIQIGAYKSEIEAKNIQNSLRENNIKTYIKKRNKYFILYTTADSEKEMNTIKKKLISMNYKDLLIKKSIQ
ncbi:MAG: SPOR domain-containing protein [Leptospiraceae bacterium]|nr:SPOR domain-containing protein [Leptospiraceae bacterium]MDW7975858.1 SPOR domain-containing protein [Leptospiraceae bacterium]